MRTRVQLQVSNFRIDQRSEWTPPGSNNYILLLIAAILVIKSSAVGLGFNKLIPSRLRLDGINTDSDMR